VPISNHRGLVIQLLGELLYVERRSADDFLPTLAREVSDDGLRAAIEQHCKETKEHANRVETVFRKLEVASTSNLVPQVEKAVEHGNELAGSCVDDRLADIVRAQAALQVEHWELAAYSTLLALLDSEHAEPLRDSVADEKRAADALGNVIAQLAK